LGLSLLGLGGHAHAQPAPRFKAVAFDYFVIFDANSIVPEVEMAFPGKSAEFTRIWRAKQFEYCYLRTITGRFADFSLVRKTRWFTRPRPCILSLRPTLGSASSMPI
jgi:hypothetical protein